MSRIPRGGPYPKVDEEARSKLRELRQVNKRSANVTYDFMLRSSMHSVDDVLASTRPQAEKWIKRDRRQLQRRKTPSKELQATYRFILRVAIRDFATAVNRNVPEWVVDLEAPAPATPGTREWFSPCDPWLRDIDAALALPRRSQRNARQVPYNLFSVAAHYRKKVGAEDTRSFVEVLLDRKLAGPVFKMIEKACRETTKARHGRASFAGSTATNKIKSVRGVFVAAAAEGALSPESERVLLERYGQPGWISLRAAEAAFDDWRELVREEMKKAGVVTDTARAVLPPEDKVLVKVENGAYQLFRSLRAEHETKGLNLNDFARWREWSPSLRNLLGSWCGFRCLYSAGMRIATLHAVQPALTRAAADAEPRFSDALEFVDVLVKNITIETKDGPKTKHGNHAYGEEAPGQESSNWTALGPLRPIGDTPFALSLRELFEFALHATGQCRGEEAGCDASPFPVFRWWSVSSNAGTYSYLDESTGETFGVSKNGEWLAGLRALQGVPTRFNPFWFDDAGREPLLLRGLTSRIQGFIEDHADAGAAAHEWRHFALHYLTRVLGIQLEDAARLIHMDLLTAQRVYNNPRLSAMLKAYADRWNLMPQSHYERERDEYKAACAASDQKVRELEYQIRYAETVLQRKLPRPPTRLPPEQTQGTSTPVPASGPKRRARTRLVPLGSGALTV